MKVRLRDDGRTQLWTPPNPRGHLASKRMVVTYVYEGQVSPNACQGRSGSRQEHIHISIVNGNKNKSRVLVWCWFGQGGQHGYERRKPEDSPGRSGPGEYHTGRPASGSADKDSVDETGHPEEPIDRSRMPDHMAAKPPELRATCGPAAVQVHVCNEAFRSLPQTLTSTSSLALTVYQLFNPPFSDQWRRKIARAHPKRLAEMRYVNSTTYGDTKQGVT